MTGTEAHGETEKRDLMMRLASELVQPGFPRGDLASLRRMDFRTRPGVPAFWRLATKYGLSESSERQWGLILHGMALMTRPEQPDSRSRLAHRPRRNLGAALAEADFSEHRLDRLLAARGDMLWTLLERGFRILAREGAAIDWWTVFHLIGPDPEQARRDVARAFYRRHHETEKSKQTDAV